MDGKTLLDLCASRPVVVYGTGYLSETFRYALLKHGLWDRVIAYAVTDPAAGPKTHHGLPVLAPEDPALPADALFCLAVHESAAKTLLPCLAERGHDVLRAAPYLTELIYGAPQKREQLPLGGLLRLQDPEANWLAVRYLAALDVLAGREDHGELYRRAMAVHCTPETAERRLCQLKELVWSMQSRGFDPDRPILIDTRGRIIDGLHRAAAAAALGLARVWCDVTEAGEDYDRLLGGKNRIPAPVLQAAGFSEEEIALLRRAREEMLARCPEPDGERRPDPAI